VVGYQQFTSATIFRVKVNKIRIDSGHVGSLHGMYHPDPEEGRVVKMQHWVIGVVNRNCGAFNACMFCSICGGGLTVHTVEGNRKEIWCLGIQLVHH
jgi:hypothetical protein